MLVMESMARRSGEPSIYVRCQILKLIYNSG